LRTALLILLVFCSVSLAQEFNKTVVDSESGKPMLVGNCNLEAFKDTTFSWWWNSSYKLYDVDTATVNEFADEFSNLDITIVMGTWCSDSRTEVPHFIKILDEADYNTDRLKIIGVDRDKKENDVDIGDLQIELVPTMIFYKDGKEIGRIVETPYDSLEKDMLKILKG
jgi:thiol-disulfide isomerase/thioredoxin